MRVPVTPSDDVIVRDFPTSKQNGGFPQAPVPKPRPRRARSGMIASATGPQQQMASAESAERRRGASESGEYIHILYSSTFNWRTKFCLSLC